MPPYRRKGESLILDVQAAPSASRTQIRGIKEDRLRVSLAAAPEDGKANLELRTFLAKRLGCAKTAIKIVAGEKARKKTLELPASCETALAALTAEAAMNEKTTGSDVAP